MDLRDELALGFLTSRMSTDEKYNAACVLLSNKQNEGRLKRVEAIVADLQKRYNGLPLMALQDYARNPDMTAYIVLPSANPLKRETRTVIEIRLDLQQAEMEINKVVREWLRV